MIENHNEMFFAHLKQAMEHFMRLPLWRFVLYTVLFIFTDGNILLVMYCYLGIKDIIRSVKEIKRLNKEIKELEKELEELQKSQNIVEND